MDFDLATLETFVRLAGCGSFSEVAKQQDLTQPAVTLRIAKLESLTGLRLFARQPDRVLLTRAGEELVDEARAILREHDSLVVRMGHFLRETRGGVRIWIDRSEHGERLAAALGEEAAPAGCEVVRALPTDDWRQLVAEQAVDLAVAGSFLDPGENPALRHCELGHQRGCTLAWNRDYFDFDPANLRFPEVLRFTLIVPDRSLVPGYVDFLGKWCLHHGGVQAPELLACADEGSARDACVAGLGVMMFPGDARGRMGLSPQVLGIAKAFDFLLPESYRFALHLRADERRDEVLRAALWLRERFQWLKSPGWED
jgi:DNA-binding transcriptional LysR family regulator